MRDLWIEPFGGMAGDMFLAALLDLGDERFTLEHLRGLAEALVPGEARLSTSEAWRGNLSGTHLDLVTPEGADPPHRGLTDLARLLEDGATRAPGLLTPAVRARTLEVLRAIAEAEGRVHGCSPDEVHFHEVGAVDTLVDVAGAALALELLGVRRVHVAPPLVGSGTVRCAHGEMPVPAPAVAELLRGRPTRVGGGCERTTPTGAALLLVLAPTFASPAGFRAERVGYGAGTKDPAEQPPNLLRVTLGETLDPDATGTASAADPGRPAADVPVWCLELNLDDMSPEEVGHALGRLRDAGALEVWSTPVAMKKDRPACVVTALCREERRAELEAACFTWTSTFGVRWSAVRRTECGRALLQVSVEGHGLQVKRRVRPGQDPAAPPGAADLFPEHDHVVRVAEATGRTLREVRALALEAALRATGPDAAH